MLDICAFCALSSQCVTPSDRLSVPPWAVLVLAQRRGDRRAAEAAPGVVWTEALATRGPVPHKPRALCHRMDHLGMGTAYDPPLDSPSVQQPQASGRSPLATRARPQQTHPKLGTPTSLLVPPLPATPPASAFSRSWLGQNSEQDTEDRITEQNCHPPPPSPICTHLHSNQKGG